VEEFGFATFMLAKAEGTVRLDGLAVVALVETAQGVEALPEIVGSPSVVGLMWGADDLVASLGGTASRRPTGGYRDVARHVRSRVLLAGKAAGRFVLDAVYLDIPDLAGLRDEADDAVAVGFDGKVAIHPSQVPVIRDAYRPSAEQLDWAYGVLAAGSAGGVATYEGRMIDGPVFRQAERIVRLADPARSQREEV
jgi:citrate lyase subunit beta/citryl-CoA lyase